MSHWIEWTTLLIEIVYFALGFWKTHFFGDVLCVYINDKYKVYLLIDDLQDKHQFEEIVNMNLCFPPTLTM